MADTEGGQGSAPKGLWMPGRGQWGAMEGLRAEKRQTFRKVTVVGGWEPDCSQGAQGFQVTHVSPCWLNVFTSPSRVLGVTR